MTIGEVLQLTSVDSVELQQLLNSHFGSSHLDRSEENVVWYGSSKDERILGLKFGKKGVLDAVLGPQGSESDIDAVATVIQEFLLNDQKKSVAQGAMFSSVPVIAAWRHQGRIHILPMPADAPRPEELAGDHPFIIEVPYLRNRDTWVDVGRRERAMGEAGLLLSALVHPFVFRPDSYSRKHWVFHPGRQPGKPLQSEWAQEGYDWVGRVGIADEFSENAELTAMDQVPAAEYYLTLGIRTGQTLQVPNSIDACLDAFYAADIPTRTRYLRAAYWFRHANQVYTHSRSASLAALVHSVESLIPPEPPGPACRTCGRSTGKGPTETFKHFIEELAPGSFELGRKELYRARSNIVHGNRLMISDSQLFGALSPDRLEEDDLRGEAVVVARSVLVNWLRPETIPPDSANPLGSGTMFSVTKSVGGKQN